MSATLQEVITHYQRKIEKSENDRPKLLHCINKLYSLPVTVQHLQATGIGRTVNSLRKDDGEIGVAAKALVAKWKAMVAAEESSDPNDEDVDDGGGGNRNRKDDEKYKIKRSSNDDRERMRKQSKLVEEIENDWTDGNDVSEVERPSRTDSPKENPVRHSSTDQPKDISKDHHTTKHHNHRTSHSSNSHNSNSSHEKRSGTTDGTNHRHKSSHSHSSDKEKVRDKNHHHHRTEREGKSSTSKSLDEKVTKEQKDSVRPKDGKEKSTSSSSSSSAIKLPDGDGTKKRVKESSTGSSTKKSDKETTKRRRTDDTTVRIDEIDSSMGTSFADALGMMMPTKSSKSSGNQHQSTSKSNSKSTASVKNQSPSSSTRTKVPNSPSKSGVLDKPESTSKSPPSLLLPSAKLAPLVDLSVELPTISNNYRPMPLNQTVMDCVFKDRQPKKMMTDEEAFGASISSKSMRTKVYSGIKTGAIQEVPTLHELCIRTLQKNIDALEYTGGVPYDILKPVLERASPDQLEQFEHFNPYLLEDTDVLWQKHCSRKFRTNKRLEMESWREMYLRCAEEQEARFRALTETISHSQTVAVPLKQTKLAYVNSMVKPPRNIIRKQAQYGTERKLVATPASRVASLNNGAPNITKVGDQRLKALSNIKDTLQQAVAVVSRPRKAPLMAKSLQLMKGRFKR